MNPYAWRIVTRQGATRKVMKIKSFSVWCYHRRESQIWGVKRGVGTPDNDSQGSKRLKLSDTGVISVEPQSVKRLIGY